MSEIIRTPILDQATVLDLQDYVANNLPTVELDTDHHFAPGVYARVMKAPAGTVVVGKAHRDDHICILLKGSLTVTMENGSTKYMSAPAIWTAKGGQKKVGFVHEDLEFVNVHPTDTEDLDVIESKVIIPEEEYRLEVMRQASLGISPSTVSDGILGVVSNSSPIEV